MKSIGKRIKNYFIVGLIAILPLWISYYILVAVFNIVASGAKPILKAFGPLKTSPAFLDLFSFLATVLLVFVLGLVLTNVIGRRVFLILESYFTKVPLLSWIYTSIRKLTALFYHDISGESRFKRVVMIEYPRKGIYVIGFMTTDAIPVFNRISNEELVNIFLPTTPNPTSGFLLMVPKKDIMPLDISVEDAVKLIVSGGIAAPEATVS